MPSYSCIVTNKRLSKGIKLPHYLISLIIFLHRPFLTSTQNVHFIIVPIAIKVERYYKMSTTYGNLLFLWLSKHRLTNNKEHNSKTKVISLSFYTLQINKLMVEKQDCSKSGYPDTDKHNKHLSLTSPEHFIWCSPEYHSGPSYKT